MEWRKPDATQLSGHENRMSPRPSGGLKNSQNNASLSSTGKIYHCDEAFATTKFTKAQKFTSNFSTKIYHNTLLKSIWLYASIYLSSSGQLPPVALASIVMDGNNTKVPLHHGGTHIQGYGASHPHGVRLWNWHEIFVSASKTPYENSGFAPKTHMKILDSPQNPTSCLGLPPTKTVGLPLHFHIPCNGAHLS